MLYLTEPFLLSTTMTWVIGILLGGFVLMLFCLAMFKKKETPGAPGPQAQTQLTPVSASPTSPQKAIPGSPSPINATPGTTGVGRGMGPAAPYVDLYTVDDRTAALLMAIVADDLKVEPNTLRFISIKEA